MKNVLSLYVSGFSSKENRGIYLYDFDTNSGRLSAKGLVIEAEDPSYLVASSSGEYIYALNEVKKYQGQNTGYVSAYACDKKDGSLTLINQQPTHGENPCHATLDVSHRHLLVANYYGGSVTSIPIEPYHSHIHAFGKPLFTKKHLDLGFQPSHTIPDRQAIPHAHSIDLDPATGTWAISMDLGCDAAVVYRFNKETGELTYHSAFQFEKGTGPRHLKFAPNNYGLCYVVTELSNEVYMLEFNSQEGVFKEVQRITTLPEGFKEVNIPAEIDITPNGKFLLVSNRGHDSIAVFRIDELSGKLSIVDHYASGGMHPRHFTIDPTGEYLLVANKDSSNIVVFKMNSEEGHLKFLHTVDHPTPSCVLFRP
ncbi:Lactonase, 7-bladed beta-propeller-domain-containing protein [Spinellus fusiger]|nr:Lactonase, 7-bladed beta-propeller-domain-containing protein [Spinellus fusiger]